MTVMNTRALLLYRLEERGWIKGTWVEKPEERRVTGGERA